MNGSELRIQLWTLHVAEAGRTWPFLIRIPSQFKAFQVLINFEYARVAHDECDSENQTLLAAGYECWCWTEAQLRQLRKKIPAESWVSWPNSTNPKIERRLTNVQGPARFFPASVSAPCLSHLNYLNQTRDLISTHVSTLDFNFQSKYKQFLFFEDVKKFDVNWWFQ